VFRHLSQLDHQSVAAVALFAAYVTAVILF
jgi:hypothetical protein